MNPQTIEGYAEDILGELPAHIRHLCILAGGALRAFCDGTPVKDYDIFFGCDADFQAAVNVIETMDWPEVATPPGRHYGFTAPSGKVFNFIGIEFGAPEFHIRRFDFRCCAIAAYFLYGVLTIEADPEAAADARASLLHVRNNNGDERTLVRIGRYRDYGYSLVEFGPDGPDAEPRPADLPDTAVPIGTREAVLRELIRRLPKSSGGY